MNIDKHIKKKVNCANKAIEIIKTEHQKALTITEINQLMYATATVVAGKQKPFKHKKHTNMKPKWQIQLERKISQLRKDASLVSEIS